MVKDGTNLRRRSLFTIRGIMLVIAGYAVALAVLPRSMLVIGSFLLIPLGGLIVLVKLTTRMSWTRVGAWVFAVYPLAWLGMLYVTWLIAWASLGHRPIWMRDDPEMISRLVSLLYVGSFTMLVGWLPALFACLACLAVERAEAPHKLDRAGGAWPIAAMAFLAWSAAVIVLNFDPGGVIDWYMD